MSKYQELDPLSPEQLAALEADIKARGVLIPIDVDEDGNILDGHNRADIAERLGVKCPKVVRRFNSEDEKREHVIKMNILRRQLTPHAWGKMFKALCAIRGVRQGSSYPKGHKISATTATMASVAADLGIPSRTARRHVAASNVYEQLPMEAKKQVDRKAVTLEAAAVAHGVKPSHTSVLAQRNRDAIQSQVQRGKGAPTGTDKLKALWLKTHPNAQKSFISWLRARGELD